MPRYLQDSPKDFVLDIKKRHVAKGEKNKKGSCAAALCALEIPGIAGATIGKTTSTLIFSTSKIVRFVNSRELSERIRAFDAGEGFKLGKVRLLAVPESLTLGSISRRMARRRAEGYKLADKKYTPTGSKTHHKINQRHSQYLKDAAALTKQLFGNQQAVTA